MNAIRWRAAIAFALMVVAVAVAWAWKPTKKLADLHPPVQLEALFPKQFGPWVVDERTPALLVSPDQQAVLDKLYNQTLSRTYVNGSGDRVMLSVAYGGDQSDATRAHRPEVCYPAQGFQMLSQQSAALSLQARQLPVRQLVAKLGGRVEPITYWVVVGETIAVSGTDQKRAQLGYSVRGLIPDGLLVRVSTIDNEPARAFTVQQGFIQALAQAIQPEAAPRVFGR